MCMDKIIKHKNAYIKALESAISGNELNVSFPKVDSTSPYYSELNEEQEVSSFAYEVGRALKGNVGGGDNGDNNDGGVSTSHNHDDRYAKIVHNHDGRYYTKIQIDEWRDRLINGDLLFNKINANHIQAGTIVAGSTIIANGAIGSAQISKVSADKLDAGIIDTSRITIAGANGNLKLRGNRLQVFEGIGSNQYERVSLGDVNNDGTVYGLRVRGADGNTILYDENGVYREGITDGSINNDKIAGDANIDGGKLNIHSVITNINENNTGTIHGTKIDIDGESVSSKVFKIELNQDEQSETIKRQQSEIDQNKEQIKLKVSNQKYTEDMASMTSKLEKAESDIEILNEGIKLTASKTEVKNQISEVKDFVSSEIGDISVGGANYLNNSAPRKATVDELITWDRTLNGTRRLTYWQDYNDSVELPQVGYHPHIDLETFHFPCIALINRNAKFSMANRELSLRHEIHKAEEVIIPNETYVVSFDAYSDTNLFSFHGGLYHKNVESSNYNYHSGRMDITIEQEHVNTWQRYSFTFTTHKGIDTSQPIYLVVNGHNNPEGSGYIKNIKLERSNIVSQWTPSQFDIDDSLDDVVDDMKEYTNESIKTNNAQLRVEFDNITSRVEATEKDVDGVKGSVSEISQRADSITSTVTDLSGKYTELKQTVDGFNFTGLVKFEDLSKLGGTVINGGNIDTTNLRVRGELISGQINGVGGIKFADGAVIASYDSHVPGYKGISISAPSIKLGDKVDIYSPTLVGTVTGKGSSSSSSSSWTMSSSGGLNCSTINTSSTTTIGGSLNVRNNMINGMNNLQMGRGSVYIPIFGSSSNFDYIKGGRGTIAFADTGPIHFLYNGTKSSFIAGGSVYLPHAGNVNCDHFRLGAGIMASPSSGSFHFLTANGATSPLYAGILYSATRMSLDEPMVISNNSVFDKINSIDVIETKDGLRLYNPIPTTKAIDKSTEVVKTEYDEDKNEINTSIDYTSAISTLWKAVQELKQENEELKKLTKEEGGLLCQN